MLLRIIQKLFSSVIVLKNRVLFLWFFLIAVFLRLPFFFRDYIDRDESTFILMAQSVVDGNLLYTDLWDLKPPLVFYFIALIIYGFGKSFLAIRLAGALLVSIIAFFTFKIGEKVHSRGLGLWAGILTIYLCSLFGSVQGLMSEHLSMAFFMPALYLLMTARGMRLLIASGVLMGLALMSKLNLAYSVVFAALFLLIAHRDQVSLVNRIKKFMMFCTGVLLVPGLLILPYIKAGKSWLFIKSVFLAPLAYASIEEHPFSKIIPFIVILGLFFFLAFRKHAISLRNRNHLLIVLMTLGIALSFIRVGKINGHYLLQFYPVFIILLALLVKEFVLKHKGIFSLFALGLLFLLPIESYKEYASIAREYASRGSFYNGEGIRIPEYLEDKGLQTGDVLFFEYHIGYWVLGINPPSRIATHPSNICRDILFPYLENKRRTSMGELRFILKEIKPLIIVVKKESAVFDLQNKAENEFVERVLEVDYSLLETIGESELYKRSKLP